MASKEGVGDSLSRAGVRDEGRGGGGGGAGGWGGCGGTGVVVWCCLPATAAAAMVGDPAAAMRLDPLDPELGERESGCVQINDRSAPGIREGPPLDLGPMAVFIWRTDSDMLLSS